MISFFRKKEVKNAGWIIGEKVAQMLLSLFVGVISARYLGPSNYGLVSYGNALVAFFMSLCTLGINSVIVKEFLDKPEAQGETLGTTIVLRLVSSFLSSLLVIAISFVVDYGNWETVVVVALCSISLIFHAFDSIKFWFQSKYNSKFSVIAAFVAYVLTSLYKIILLILNKSVAWFAFATSFDYIMLGLLLYIAYKKNGGPPLRFSLKRGKEILSKSYHYILSGIMVAIYGQTDKLMLKHMLNEAEVGYYAVATAVCSMWTFVLTAIIESMYPTIVSSFKSGEEIFNKRNRQLYAIVFYISFFVSVCFMIGGELVIWILYGKEFMGAVLPLKIVTWYTAFSYLGVARNAWMVCNDKQKYIKFMYIPAVIVNVILNSVFIPAAGAVGAALASLITQMSTSIILPYCFKEVRPNAKLMIEAILLKDVFEKKDKRK